MRESASKPDRGIVAIETRGFNQNKERVIVLRRRYSAPETRHRMRSEQPDYTRELVGFLHPLQASDLARRGSGSRAIFPARLSGVRDPRLARRIVGRRPANDPTHGRQRMLHRDRHSHAHHSGSRGDGQRRGRARHRNGRHAQRRVHSSGRNHVFRRARAGRNVPETSSDAFFAAVVAGFEAAARIAMAVQPKEHYALGFHMTPTCGVFGAAITSAKLLGLTADQTLAAVGIAGSMAAGSMEFLADGAWTKRIHPGLAAQNGIHAALLAAEGFTGPLRILEGRDGFLHGYSRNPLPDRLTAGLGESFEILHTAVKPHACCRYMQGPIDAHARHHART